MNLARSVDNRVLRNHQSEPVKGRTPEWDDLGGSAAGDPVVIRDAQGKMAAFVVDTDGQLRENPDTQPTPNGVSTVWENLGGRDLVGTPAAVLDTNGRLFVFVRDRYGELWVIHLTGSNDDTQSPLQRLPGPKVIDDPVVYQNAAGRVVVFALGKDHMVRTQIQAAQGSGTWESAGKLAGGDLATSPAVTMDSGGKLRIFAVSADGSVLQNTENDKASNTWEGWKDLGASPDGEFVGRPIAVTDHAETVVVFALSETGKMYETFQLDKGKPGWHDWNDHGGSLRRLIAAVEDAAGQLVVSAMTVDGQMQETWQTVPAGGPWADWLALPGERFAAD